MKCSDCTHECVCSSYSEYLPYESDGAEKCNWFICESTRYELPVPIGSTVYRIRTSDFGSKVIIDEVAFVPDMVGRIGEDILLTLEDVGAYLMESFKDGSSK